MKLSKIALKDLTNHSSWSDVHDRYFVDSSGNIEFDNILQLFEAQLINAQNAVEFFKHLNALCIAKRETQTYSQCLINIQLMNILLQPKFHSVLKHIFDHAQNERPILWIDFMSDVERAPILYELLKIKPLNAFRHTVDALKHKNALFLSLSKSGVLFEDVIKKAISADVLKKDDVQYLYSKVSSIVEATDLISNEFLATYILRNALEKNFKSLIDKNFGAEEARFVFNNLFETTSHIDFQYYVNNGFIKKSDVLYFLSNLLKLNASYGLEAFLKSPSLVQCMLNHHIAFEKKTYAELASYVARHQWSFESHTNLISYLKKRHPQFKIELESIETLKLLKLPKTQLIEIYELCKNDELTLNKLKNITENQLDGVFNFDDIISYLKKQTKKSMLCI